MFNTGTWLTNILLKIIKKQKEKEEKIWNYYFLSASANSNKAKTQPSHLDVNNLIALCPSVLVILMGKSLNKVIFTYSEGMSALPLLYEDTTSWLTLLQNCEIWGDRDPQIQQNNVHTGFISNEIPWNFIACIQKLRKQKSFGDCMCICKNLFCLLYAESHSASRTTSSTAAFWGNKRLQSCNVSLPQLDTTISRLCWNRTHTAVPSNQG